MRAGAAPPAGAAASSVAVVQPRDGSSPPLLVLFRGIVREDVPELDAMQRRLFPVRYSEAFYSRLFEPGHYTVLATAQTGEIIGIASARTVADDGAPPPGRSDCAPALDGGREGYVMTLGVDAPYRRHGVGAELLRRILAALRAASCVTAALHVKVENAAACAFYERLGFRPDPVLGYCADHYLIDGAYYDAYRLVCPLQSSWMGWLASKLGLATDPLAPSTPAAAAVPRPLDARGGGAPPGAGLSVVAPSAMPIAHARSAHSPTQTHHGHGGALPPRCAHVVGHPISPPAHPRHAGAARADGGALHRPSPAGR